jgi:hypothetical protein
MTRFRLAAGLVVIGLLVVGIAVSAYAQLPSPTLAVSLEPSSRPELADLFIARLTTPEGEPINEARVEFWIRSHLFGERYAFVGEALTDSSGVARLPFVPHQDTYDVRATFDGDEVWGSVETIRQLEFPPSRVIRYEPTDPTQLGSLRSVMPRVMGIVVGVMWAALLALAFFTLRSIKRLGSIPEDSGPDR